MQNKRRVPGSIEFFVLVYERGRVEVRTGGRCQRALRVGRKQVTYATRLASTALAKSYVACKFSQSFGEVPRVSARSSAASAVMPRLPRISSFKRARLQPISVRKPPGSLSWAPEIPPAAFRPDEKDFSVVCPRLFAPLVSEV